MVNERELLFGDEARIQKFLETECYTSAEEKDPSKPLIFEDGLVSINPDYDPNISEIKWTEKELERRKIQLGTSFFFSFDPICKIHQLTGSEGDAIRYEIIIETVDRFVQVFSAQFPNNPPSPEEIKEPIDARLSYAPREHMDNGELYIWMRGLYLNEEFIFTMIREMKKSLKENPVMANYKDEDYPVLFYGWGFRHL